MLIALADVSRGFLTAVLITNFHSQVTHRTANTSVATYVYPLWSSYKGEEEASRVQGLSRRPERQKPTEMSPCVCWVGGCHCCGAAAGLGRAAEVRCGRGWGGREQDQVQVSEGVDK